MCITEPGEKYIFYVYLSKVNAKIPLWLTQFILFGRLWTLKLIPAALIQDRRRASAKDEASSALQNTNII